jgi:hypothetical protein
MNSTNLPHTKASARRSVDSTANFSIVSFGPKQSPTDGGAEIIVVLNETFPCSSPFCRFNTVLSQSTVLPGNSLQCISPKYPPWKVPLLVSLDGVSWSSDVAFLSVAKGNAVSVLIAIFLGVSLISFALFMFQMRQCKNEQKKSRKELPQAIVDSYPVHRIPDVQSLNRKSPPLL